MIKKAYQTIRKAALGGVLALSLLSSCEHPTEPPNNGNNTKRNSAPSVSLSVSPKSGVSPLEVKLTASADDPDGASDIADYKVVLKNRSTQDSVVFSKNPLDTLISLKAPQTHESITYDISAYVKDKSNASDSKKDSVVVFSSVPEVSQQLSLENFVDIKSSITIKNLEGKALRKILRNNQLIKQDTLKEGTYDEIFTSQQKGKYDFIVSWQRAGRDSSIVKSIEVPNYNPELNTDSLNLDIDEESEKTIVLPLPTDKNPEDNPVPYISITTSSDKISLTSDLSSRSIKIKGLEDKVGDYTIEVLFGSNEAGTASKEIKATIYDLLDVSGVLEDNEQHKRWPGIVKVFSSNSDLTFPPEEEISYIGGIVVDNSGTFKKQFPFRIKDLEQDIFIQARRIENNVETSYIRTIRMPKKDATNLVMRVVPYDGLAERGITPEQFRKFGMEVGAAGMWPIRGTEKNVNQPFKFIAISKQYYRPNEDPGFFSQQQAEALKARLLDPNDLGAWFNGYIKDTSQVRIFETAEEIFKEGFGILRIWPKRYINGGLASVIERVTPFDGYVDLGDIDIEVKDNGYLVNQFGIAHEVGHVALGGSHATEMPCDYTIMQVNLGYCVGSPTARWADRKLAKAIYEETYINGTGRFKELKYFLIDSDFLDLSWLKQ
ncbi:MAG: hypothetical protein KatS3mg001_508 [Candidatus Pacearchaeota archaeon]|nr:MAG: hypothetical protein KatS3mg001_508 [Candidatus Pacearchaeota archaeon]